MAKQKRRLSKKEAVELVSTAKEFNGIATQFLKLLGIKVEKKKKRINVLLTRVKLPQQQTSKVNVRTVQDIGKGFIEKQRKKKRKGTGSLYDESFSQRKGWII